MSPIGDEASGETKCATKSPKPDHPAVGVVHEREDDADEHGDKCHERQDGRDEGVDGLTPRLIEGGDNAAHHLPDFCHEAAGLLRNFL